MTISVDVGYWSGSFTYTPPAGPQAGVPIVLSIGTGPDANGIAWIWEKIDGWDSPDVSGSVIQRGGDHGGFPALQVYAPRSMTVTVRASAPTQAMRDLARAIMQQVIPVNDLCLMRYNEPIPKQAWVRRSGRIVESYDNLTEVEFSCVLIAPDPRKYGTTLKVSPSTTWVSQNYMTIGKGSGRIQDNFLQGDDATFEASVGHWLNGGGATVTRSTTLAHAGSASLTATCSTAGTMTVVSCSTANYATQMLACNPGDTIIVSGWVQAATILRNCQVGAGFYTSAGVVVGGNLLGTAVANTVGGWTQITASITVPATAAWCRMVALVQSAALNEVHNWDDMYIRDAAATDNFLQGATATFDGGISTWTNVLNSTQSASSTVFRSGNGSLILTSIAAGNVTGAHCLASSILTQGMAVNPGDIVFGSIWVQAQTVGRPCQVGASFYTAAGVVIGGTPIFGPTVNDVVGSWVQITGSVIAPATAVRCRLHVQVVGTGAGGEVHYFDDAYMFNGGYIDVAFTLPNNPPPPSGMLLNAGNFETRPVITINGPLHAPGLQLQSTGQSVTWTNLNLNPGDIMIVDFDAKMAWINPGTITPDVPLQASGPLTGYVAADVWSSWFVLYSGMDNINLISGASVVADAGIMIVRSRDAWI